MTHPEPERTEDPRTPAVEIPVALVRDYQQINRELIRALDLGLPRIRLVDVEGQRLLAFGLRGPWRATIEVVGNAGPELAADLDAEGVTVLCTGSAGDGAGRGLRAGRLAICRDAGDAVGAGMTGGSILVAGRAGHRAGLRLRGGTLLILGPAGRLMADRQEGGIVIADPRSSQGPGGRAGGGGGRIDLRARRDDRSDLDVPDVDPDPDALVASMTAIAEALSDAAGDP
ncbi:GltB/FmdC/FwdC-like GXGXG domain-containing protein [Tautonia plasticadhaerens]|uniref:GXGXG motif protein n=1 Tax=Tautonia plasticadhaerens TaxID=2527974 RepID=A0A518H8E0_9BACT|nr:glutamate synthase [Tautonia plasticadhaerens]QDV37081.1 GXGXG motif protein [Tautonia plasticadhaerens]